jgi:hypothetical protein
VTAMAVAFDLWARLERPDGKIRTSPPRPMSLEPGETLTRSGRLRIPAQSPSGTYRLHGLVGSTFPTADDSDGFTFMKE